VLTSDAAQRIGRLLVEDEDRDGGLTVAMPMPRLPARVAALGIFLGIALATLHAAHPSGSLAARASVSPADPNGRPEELPMPQSVTRAAMASAVALSVATSGHAQDAVQWRVEDGGNGHWYQWRAQGTYPSWIAARDAAFEAGGYLASIRSELEEQFVRSVIGTWTCGVSSESAVAIGGFQPNPKDVECCWEWVSGEAWTDWSPWSGGEPDNGPSEPESILLMRRDGGWNDGNIEYGPYWACRIAAMFEWSADCNADGIVDYGQIRAGDLADTNGNNIPDCCESLPDACAGDLVRDGRVDGVDLAAVLSNWGLSEGAALNADANCDGVVDGQDLATVLGSWGKCP
jgi:hypothetical protein